MQNHKSGIELWFFFDEGPMLETLDYTIRIGSTPTFLYFDLYLYSAYAAHFIYIELYTYTYNVLSEIWNLINIYHCFSWEPKKLH